MSHLTKMLCAIAALSAPANAIANGLRDGLYEVSVMLDMGQLEDLNARKITQICVHANSRDGAYGFFLITNNIQLAHCPVKNVAETANTLTFDIICDGIDAGRASATYTFEPDAFEGRYVMRMGGKNMTMREAQSGHRVGDCAN